MKTLWILYGFGFPYNLCALSVTVIVLENKIGNTSSNLALEKGMG